VVKSYLSIRQICERLPVCKTLVYRLVRDGDLPSTRFGGKILVPVEALEALLEGRAPAEPAAPPPPVPPTVLAPAARKSRKGRGLELW
jgi:excisionase family DNA binding protein